MAKTILLVVSDLTERQGIAQTLLREGLEVIPAEDGFSALEKVEKAQPDLFLMDVRLIGLNGVEISQLLRERPRFADSPIILLGDPGSPVVVDEAGLSSGVVVLMKPVPEEELVHSVRHTLGLPDPASPKPARDLFRDGTVRIEEFLGLAPKAPSPVTSERPVEEALKTLWEGRGIDSLIRMEPLEEKAAPVAEPETELPLPAASLPTAPSLSPEKVEEIVERSVREIVEKVVWEVVPRLAEIEIKKEIERLKKGE
ncbi:MAG: response regulator [Nitrospirae bacterium]|nr:response regulator [Nitrospirota bacterium]